MCAFKLEWPVPFALRDATMEDIDPLWRIDQTCFPGAIAYTEPELRFFMLRRGSFTLVACREGDPANIQGFIVAHAGRIGHIITIDVIAAARRSGVGSLLLAAAEDRLRISGASAVELEAAVDNKAALKFYERHGYEVVTTIPGYYSTGIDAFRLRKTAA